MIRIRDEQFAALELDVLARANARLARYARERFPEHFQDAPDEQLVALVVKVRERARRHGITAEPDVATALDLTVMYGPDFYDADWARDVFAIPRWSGPKKLDAVRARVRRRVPNF